MRRSAAPRIFAPGSRRFQNDLYDHCRARSPWFCRSPPSAALALPAPAQAQGTAAVARLARAVYDLKLSTPRGKRAMNAVRGRILYDFSGSACEGYALQFRQVSELDSGEGKVIVRDLRATSVGGRRGQAPALPFAELLRREVCATGRRPGRAGQATALRWN